MLKFNKSVRLSLLILIFVVVPALFLGFHSISILDEGGLVGAARRDVLVKSAIVFLCIIAIITGGLFTTLLVRKEMELVHLKDDFVSRISHELKTPLATIRLLAEMLEAGVKKEQKRRDYYRTICAESERLDRLVSNILNFSRIASGRLKYEPRNCAVDTLVPPVLENLALGDTGFSFAFENPDAVDSVYCSPDEVAQALLNLLENAVKYSPQPHCIRVVLRADAKEHCLTVCDRGSGIAEQYHKAIFDQFYRIGADEAQKGTGIGLAVVAAIMRMHKGRVELESAEGEGSRFSLVFPRPSA